MQTISNWLAGSPSLNLTFLLLALISLIASVYFYVKSKREKQPVYLVKTFPLVKEHVSEINGLNIQFESKPIKSLSLSRVAFWNKGRETIQGTDSVTTDPLRIKPLGEGSVLAARVTFTRRAVNSIQTFISDGAVQINFDFLDQMDGCIIDVYHTGDSSVVVAGTLKGSASLSIATFTPDYFLDRMLDITLSPVLRMLKGTIFESLAFAPLLVITFPITLPAMAMDIIAKFLFVVPKEYYLSE